MGLPGIEDTDANEVVDENVSFLAGQKDSQVDSIWWCWGEMNHAPYPSRILPVNKEYQRWLREGVDPVKICIDKSRVKGLEVFYTFRIAGGSDFGDWVLPPVLIENPHWGTPHPIFPWKNFNFALSDVRQYKLDVVREVAENYDFDGIENRLQVLSPWWPYNAQLGVQGLHNGIYAFCKDDDTGYRKKEGQAVSIASRVPENIEGSHYDGLDVERWANERLVDIFALGCHNFEVDIKGFRRITKDKDIKLYPSVDNFHTSSGYEHALIKDALIKVFRGVFSNFWYQGADGMYAFNFYIHRYDKTPFNKELWNMYMQAYREMGSPDTLKFKDKIYVTQRRGEADGLIRQSTHI